MGSNGRSVPVTEDMRICAVDHNVQSRKESI